jgi:uncharacterized protein (TIGR03492 family)
MRRVLLISDGHGEDWVAAQIARHLPCLAHGRLGAPVELLALPMVGEGHLFEQIGVSVAMPTRVLPSGGFTFKSPAHLWMDLRAGLAEYGQSLVHTARMLSGWADLVLAVGDILPLGLAWMTGKPYIFVGCTKSDYYTGGGASCYLAPERLMMRPPRCRHAFTRDALTCHNLRNHRVLASYWGNPMMDGLETAEGAATAAEGLFVGVLPGSRAEEAQRNLADMLPCLQAIREAGGAAIHFEVAVSAGLGLESFHGRAASEGWRRLSEHRIEREGTVVHLHSGNFRTVLHRSQLILGMAGTAVEQAVGLGKPVITIPGRGPQFTRRFAHLQRDLLGESVLVVDRPVRDRPGAVARTFWSVIGDGERLHDIRRNGRDRMGTTGAARRIAEFAVEQLPQPLRDTPRPRS